MVISPPVISPQPKVTSLHTRVTSLHTEVTSLHDIIKVYICLQDCLYLPSWCYNRPIYKYDLDQLWSTRIVSDHEKNIKLNETEIFTRLEVKIAVKNEPN